MEEHEILDQLDIGSPVTLGLNSINTQLTDTLWQNSILKEFTDMNKRQVFQLLHISNLPTQYTLIGNKWVLVIKRDGCHCSCIVMLRYTQIPGVDFWRISPQLFMISPSIQFWYLPSSLILMLGSSK